MIKVTIYKTERQEYAGFDMEGHAGYAEAGEDIVCAGVSALVINALNSIERFTDDETSCVSDEDTGSIEFRFDGIPSHDATLLLDSMILGLEEIEDSNDYEKYIDIIFKVSIPSTSPANPWLPANPIQPHLPLSPRRNM